MDIKNDVTAQSFQSDLAEDDVLLDQATSSGAEELNIEVAAKTEGDLGDPIGSVETLVGDVTVTHADGTSFSVNIGDKLYQGDTIETGGDGGIGVVFADTSTLALSEDAELILDEMVYDPGTQEGSSIISLVEGSMDFVSGQIAKISPDAVSITTPVATIGIRGTKVFVEYVDGEFRAVNLLEPTLDGEAAGEIVLFDLEGNPLGTINEAGSGWEFSEVDGETLLRLIKLDPSQIEQLTEKLEALLPESLIEKARDALELKEALEEAAALAAEEVRLAEEALEAALEDAQAADLMLKEALEQLKLIQTELAAVEAELEQAQFKLTELMTLNGGTLPPNAISLQNEILKLRETSESLIREIKRAEQQIAELQQEADDRWDLYNLASEDLDGSKEVYDVTLVALNEITEVANNATEEVASNDGYEANSDGGDDTDDLSIEELTNLATASGGDGNQDHLLSGGDGDNGGTFQPHEQNDYQGLPQTGTGGSTGGDSSGGLGGKTPTPKPPKEEPVNPPLVDAGQQTVLLDQNGRVVDGYLKNARVFLDENQNGSWDAGEIFTLTDSSGNFAFNQQVTEEQRESPVMIQAIEGLTIDVATGLEFYGTMMAPDGSAVITPVTSLISALIDLDGSLDTEQAQVLVEGAFGISPDGSITELDPVSDADNVDSARVAALGVQVQNLILQAGNLLEGASGETLTQAETSGALYEALAQKILDGSFDISDSEDIQGVIEAAADILFGQDTPEDSASLAALGDVLQDAGDVIGAFNALIDSYVTEGLSGADMLAAISRVAVVANEAAQGLNGLAQGDSEAFDTASFLTELEAKVASAEIADVTGTGGETFSAAEDNSVTFTVAKLLENDGDASLPISSIDGKTLAEIEQDGKNYDGIGTLSYDGEEFTFDPAENWNGTLEIPYTVIEADGNVKESTIVISITPVNDEPVLTVAGQIASVVEGDVILEGNVRGSDVEDDDGDLTYRLVDTELAGLTFNPDGTYTFDPTDPFYNDLDVGETRLVSFTYEVTDSEGASAQEEVTIEVSGTNDAPVTEDQTVTIHADESVLKDSVTADDAEGDDLVFSLVEDEDTGVPPGLTFNEDGTYEFDVDDDAYKKLDAGDHTESFSYIVTDDNGEADTGTVNITFMTEDDAPEAQDDVVSILTAQGLSAVYRGFSPNPDGTEVNQRFTLNDLSLSGAEEPFVSEKFGLMIAQGYINLDAGEHTFEINLSGLGMARITLGERHLHGGDIATISLPGEVQVLIEEDGPVEIGIYLWKFDDNVTVDMKLDGEIIGGNLLTEPVADNWSQFSLSDADLLANDFDYEGQDLTIKGFSFDEEEIDSIRIDENGLITIVAGEDFNEETSFEYTVSDGENESTASVSFDLTAYDEESSLVYFDGTQTVLTGTDAEETLVVSDGVNLDLTDGSVTLHSIEHIDLDGLTTGHTLNINVENVLDMTDVETGHVVVNGSENDTVNLEGEWTRSDADDEEGYSVYVGGGNAEIHISSAVQVSGL